MSIYVVEDDTARQYAAEDRAEAKRLALKALEQEAKETLLATVTGLDEVLAELLDGRKHAFLKAGFLNALADLELAPIRSLSDREIKIKESLRSMAQLMAEKSARERIKELERESEATRAGW